MKKVDPIVLKETKYIAIWVVIFSVLTQAVFLIIGKWDYTVLLGNLLSGGAGIMNFLLMGIAVQKSLGMDEKDARNHMKASSTWRMCALFVIAVLGAVIPIFNIWTALIPLLFPRIAIAIRPLWDKLGKNKAGKDESKEDTKDAT